MRHKQHRGFTIIETLVAITILTTSIVGPMYAIRNALVTSYTARDKLIATSLAQESIELIRQIRDNNYLYNLQHESSPKEWTEGLDALACYSTNPVNTEFCVTDSTENAVANQIQECDGACGPLYISATNLYTQSNAVGATPTTFYRTVQMYEARPDELRILVTVTWKTNTVQYSITVTDVIYNWL